MSEDHTTNPLYFDGDPSVSEMPSINGYFMEGSRDAINNAYWVSNWQASLEDNPANTGQAA